MKSNTELLNDLFGYFDEIFSDFHPDHATDKETEALAEEYLKERAEEEGNPRVDTGETSTQYLEDDREYTQEDFEEEETPQLNPGGGPYNPADNI